MGALVFLSLVVTCGARIPYKHIRTAVNLRNYHRTAQVSTFFNLANSKFDICSFEAV